MTLYFNTNDSPGKSTVTGAILANWPAFNVANVVVPSSLNASDFSSITRDDGKMQTTYKGYPLYNFIKDQAPGDTQGQGINGVWFVVNPQNFPPTPSSSPSMTSSSAPSPSAASPSSTTTSTTTTTSAPANPAPAPSY